MSNRMVEIRARYGVSIPSEKPRISTFEQAKRLVDEILFKRPKERENLPWYSSLLFKDGEKRRYSYPENHRTWEAMEKGIVSEFFIGEEMRVLKFGSPSEFNQNLPTILYIPGVDKFNPLDSGELDMLIPKLQGPCNFLFVVYGKGQESERSLALKRKSQVSFDPLSKNSIYNIPIVSDLARFVQFFGNHQSEFNRGKKLKLDIMAHSYGAASLLAPVITGLVETGFNYRSGHDFKLALYRNMFMKLLSEYVSSIHFFAPVLSLEHGQRYKKHIARAISRGAQQAAKAALAGTSMGYPYDGIDHYPQIISEYQRRMGQLDFFQGAYDELLEDREWPFTPEFLNNLNEFRQDLPTMGIYLDEGDRVMDYSKVVQTLKDYPGMFFCKRFDGDFKSHYPQDDKFAQDLYNNVIFDDEVMEAVTGSRRQVRAYDLNGKELEKEYYFTPTFGDVFLTNGFVNKVIDRQLWNNIRLDRVRQKRLKRRQLTSISKSGTM